MGGIKLNPIACQISFPALAITRTPDWNSVIATFTENLCTSIDKHPSALIGHIKGRLRAGDEQIFVSAVSEKYPPVIEGKRSDVGASDNKDLAESTVLDVMVLVYGLEEAEIVSAVLDSFETTKWPGMEKPLLRCIPATMPEHASHYQAGDQ